MEGAFQGLGPGTPIQTNDLKQGARDEPDDRTGAIMARFVALLVSGLAIGGIYAITATGFLIVYKATGVVNFAHGDLMTLGAYVALWGVASGESTLLAYLVALVLLALLGLLVEQIAYAPLRNRSKIAVVIATLGVGLAIRASIGIWQGTDTKLLPTPVGNGSIHLFGAAISNHRILVMASVVVTMLAVYYLFQRTSFGRQLRALADDADAAELMGINVRRASKIAFAFSTALAAIGGILYAPMVSLNLEMGFSLLLGGFAAAILGGFGSLRGVVVGALIIGLVEYLVGGYIFTEYRSVLPFVMMVLVIAIRPRGLFPTVAKRY